MIIWYYCTTYKMNSLIHGLYLFVVLLHPMCIVKNLGELITVRTLSTWEFDSKFTPGSFKNTFPRNMNTLENQQNHATTTLLWSWNYDILMTKAIKVNQCMHRDVSWYISVQCIELRACTKIHIIDSSILP